MASPDRKVRVFISSTFKDMHAERDHLVTVVFPELRERCERLGLEFFDVDLRWGVPVKGVDGETANSWEYCKKWIDEAKPFFVCLLGQRYGWEPEPHQLKDDADRQAQATNRRSITDMEVRHALEHEAHTRRCFFYIRQAQAPDTAAEFVDPPPLLVKLKALKGRVETCGRPVWHYPCRWTGSGFTGMEEFGKRVLEDLWSGILRDPRYIVPGVWQHVLETNLANDSCYMDESKPVPAEIAEKLIPLAKPPPKSPLEAEREEMQRFAESRLHWFQGREKELRELFQFISDPAETHDTPRLALLAAQPGQGKSALMAKLWEALRHSSFELRHSTHVVAHFVGATSQSSSSYHLVRRLNDELDSSGIAFPERPTPEGQPKEEQKLDFQSLCQRLWDRLGDYAGERRIVILLDALNQLDDGYDLAWLPYRLGPSVRIVVSCVQDASSNEDGRDALRRVPNSDAPTPAEKVLTAIDSRHPKPKRIPLGPLTPDDVRTIVTSYLKEYCKELDAPHVDAICDETKLPQARNPLYLLVMLAELRTLGGNDMNQHVPALIVDMGRQHPDTVSLFHWVLQRMEQAEGFGEQAVRWWCLYLALGRVGMSSRELSDLLVRKLGPGSGPTAQRIERALRRYLQRRGEQWDFFHGQLRQAVMERCGGPKHVIEVHSDIASLFMSLANPRATGPWEVTEVHSLSELPYHLIQSAQWGKLVLTLEDIFFLEAKTCAGMPFALAQDFHAATNSMPSGHPASQRISLLKQALLRDLSFIANHAVNYPQALLQCLWNSAWHYDADSTAKHYEPLCPGGTSIWRRLKFRICQLMARTKRHGHCDHLGCQLSNLLERWRRERQLYRAGQQWFRSLRPPAIHLGAGQNFVIRNPPSTGRHDTVYGLSYSRASFSPCGHVIAHGLRSNKIQVIDALTGQETKLLEANMGMIQSIRHSPDGRFVATGSSKGVSVWEIATGKAIMSTPESADHVCFSFDGSLLAAGSETAVRIWEMGSHSQLASLSWKQYAVTNPKMPLAPRKGALSSMVFLADGRLASAHYDGSVRFWKANDERNHWQQESALHHSGGSGNICISSDGHHMAICSSSSVIVRDLHCESVVETLEGHDGYALGCAFSSDGDLLAVGESTGAIKVWQWRSKTLKNVLHGHETNESRFDTDKERKMRCLVYTVAFNPVKNQLVSVASDNTLRVWELGEFLTPVLKMPGHSCAITCIAFSPDEKWVGSGADDGTINLWSAQTGLRSASFMGDPSGIDAVCFTVDSRYLIAVGSGSRIAFRISDGKIVSDSTNSFRLPRMAAPIPPATQIEAYDNEVAFKLGEASQPICYLAGRFNLIHTVHGHHPLANSISEQRWAGSWGEHLQLFVIEGASSSGG